MAMTVEEIRAFLRENPHLLARATEYLVGEGIDVVGIDSEANVSWGEGVTQADKARARNLLAAQIEALRDNPPEREKTLEERVAQLETRVQQLIAAVQALQGP